MPDTPEDTSATSSVRNPDTDRLKARQDRLWAWCPTLPLKPLALWVWPPRPVDALRYLFSGAFLGAIMLPYLGTALIVWLFTQPALERCQQLRIDWVGQIWLRNLVLMLLFAGALHLYFYRLKVQGKERKYDARDLAINSSRFFGRRQVVDNMLWTCLSGVAVWTGYEVLYFWAAANNLIPFYLDWAAHPVSFVLVFLLVPFWTSLHFYFVHRFLHYRPVYRIAHSIHHRNDNLGPWSGLSMHPLEHIIYLSALVPHFFIASHPLHILFHMHWQTLGAAATHCGFDALMIRGRPFLQLGSFHHQLHHRFYDCNYGNVFMPWDRWFGSDHDGSPDAMQAIKARRRSRMHSWTRLF